MKNNYNTFFLKKKKKNKNKTRGVRRKNTGSGGVPIKKKQYN